MTSAGEARCLVRPEAAPGSHRNVYSTRYGVKGVQRNGKGGNGGKL